MALSQAYLEWETETKRQGFDQGIEQERRSTILNIMRLRYGSIDPELEAIIPDLIALDNETYTRLLMQCSREAIVAHFQS